MHQIEIDLAIHKAIEAERWSFEESPAAILRRLLGIDRQPASGAAAPEMVDDGMAPGWRKLGVFLPDGTQLRMTYNDKTYEGAVREGLWQFGEKAFSSPSAAATALGRTKHGKATNLNGWRLWQCRFPEASRWIPLNDLYQQARKRV